MPQPVKLSDRIVSAARKVAPLANRSLAGQIEHWATLGRSIEGLLTSTEVHALKSLRRKPTQATDAIRRALQNGDS